MESCVCVYTGMHMHIRTFEISYRFVSLLSSTENPLDVSNAPAASLSSQWCFLLCFEGERCVR